MGYTPPGGLTVAQADARYVLKSGGSDTTAPTITSFAATPGDTQVVLTWSGTDNVGISGWTLQRAGSTVYAGTATSFTDTGLTNGTTYGYTLTASDAAGNVSTAGSTTATPAVAGGASTYPGTALYPDTTLYPAA